MSRAVILSIIFGGLILLGLGYWWWGSDYPIKNFPTSKAGPILFYGDSLVEGVGAKAGGDMPSLLSVTLGEPVLNYGVAGDTSVLGVARLDDALAQEPRLVILLLGGNDFLQKVDRATTAANLKKIITQFQNEGAIVLLLGVRSGIVSGGSDEFFEEIAENTGAAYEPDVLKGIFADPSLMSDAIHPNVRGYQKIVERITPTIRELLTH